MKCIAIVVMLAFAAVNASVLAPLPLAYHTGLPLAYAPRISLAQGLAAPWAYSPLAWNHAAYTVPTAYAAPAAYAAPLAAPVAIAAPAASYVAATRGATHVAPLPGHVESVSSQNLEPAPGTL